MIGEVLREGFAAAHRRLGLVFLDILWKAIWLAVTAGAALVIISWFGEQLRSIAGGNTGIPALNGMVVAALLRRFWAEHSGEIFWACAFVFSLSLLLWLSLEAFCRARIVAAIRDRLKPAPTLAFRTFLVSGFVRSTILAAIATILGLIAFGSYLKTPLGEWPDLWLETRGVAVAGAIAFVAVAFLLTVFDTLLRSDAIVLLGTDLIRVSGVIGILLLFETMVVTSLLIGIVTGFLNVGGAAEAIVMFGIFILAIVLLSVLHSYLLLVRFSAVGIMRRNVVDV